MLPKGLPSRLFIIRQSSAFPVIRKSDGIGREEPLEFRVQLVRRASVSSLRFLSSKTSREQKESPVFQELVESREQPQTQLTVGAKGLRKTFQFYFIWSFICMICHSSSSFPRGKKNIKKSFSPEDLEKSRNNAPELTCGQLMSIGYLLSNHPPPKKKHNNNNNNNNTNKELFPKEIVFRFQNDWKVGKLWGDLGFSTC